MKKTYIILSVGCFIFGLTGCTSLQKIIPIVQQAPAVGVQSLSPYSGPKARIAVLDFEVRTSKATNEIGAGLREMLITALTNSNRFSIMGNQNLEVLLEEHELPAENKDVPQAHKTKAADLLVAVRAVEFQPQASGGRAGVGGGGGVGRGVLGSLLGSSLNKAHIALEIRVVKAYDSAIFASKSIQGQASDIGGAIMEGFSGSWGLGGGLSVYANTPMEKAIRICIIETVKYVAENVPLEYYKY